MKKEYRAIFISDIHLGSNGCKAHLLAPLLKHLKCEHLYLVGDIIDMWRLKQRWYWPTDHNTVVRRVLKMTKNGTRAIFIPGNHDDAARQFKGLDFGQINVQLEAIHHTLDGRKLLVTHGDQFDLVITNARLTAMAGSMAYDWLVVINTGFNRIRAFFGFPFWSFSGYIKNKVKSAGNFIARFESALLNEARAKSCQGVIAGHIHRAQIRTENNLTYYNCGDWVESCTLLVEHLDGQFEIIDGVQLLQELAAGKQVVDLDADDEIDDSLSPIPAFSSRDLAPPPHV
jgi:UDP-2,3-diacylglucosamine pyrophosphatase LpxH